MRIKQFGTMTLRQGQPPLIEGWLVAREMEDPGEATTEQLLVGFAITWAQERFQEAVNSAAMDVFRERARRLRENANPTTITGAN